MQAVLVALVAAAARRKLRLRGQVVRLQAPRQVKAMLAVLAQLTILGKLLNIQVAVVAGQVSQVSMGRVV
jgi:hypothetical protein